MQSIARASTTGHGTNVITGLAVGMESTAMPVLTISLAVLCSYYLGQTSGLTYKGSPTGGLFGTAVATMGMLSTAVYVLAMDVFGYAWFQFYSRTVLLILLLFSNASVFSTRSRLQVTSAIKL